jgi:exonuclease SbcD
VRVLHTSDWHLCKALHRRDRMEEYEAVLDEVVTVANDRDVDLVVHSGDVFDRAAPPPEAIRLALATLVRLTDGGRRPVVVVAGNHDSPKLFEALAPVLAPLDVHLVGDLRAPDRGGCLDLETPGGRALVSCVPWVRPASVVDFGGAGTKGALADKMRAIVGAHATHVLGEAAVSVLVAHFMVVGASVGTGHGPTGMRTMDLGDGFLVSKAAVNFDFSYFALGHIHAPQRVPGAPAGAYAGSLLQCDFGEAGEDKRVVVVDAEPGRPSTVESVPLRSGRSLVRATGRWDDLVDRSELDDVWLDLTVETDGPPTATVVDEWRSRFPLAVKLTAEFPTAEVEGRHAVAGRGLDELYAEYHASVHGAPDEALLELLRDIKAEAEA